MIKKAFFAALAMAATLLGAHANANPLGFNGGYDYATWNSYNSNGTYQHINSIDATQQTLTMYEPDNCGNDCTLGWTPSSNFLSHSVLQSGTVSFNWTFNWDLDPCCSGLNFYVNSTLYNLIGGYPGNDYKYDGSGSGFFSVAVNEGDIIKFDAFSADSCCRPAISTISNFDAPGGVPATDVPEPMSLSLIGLGLLGMGAFKRRKA